MKHFFAILFLLVMVSQAQATDRYVQPSASGGCTQGLTTYSPASNTCGSGSSTVYVASSQGNLNTAMAATNAGDRLLFRNGTYNLKIDTNAFAMHSGTSFVAANAVQFAAYPGNCSSGCETVTFTSNDGDTIVNLATGAATATLAYVIFDGLQFNGAAINAPSHGHSNVAFGTSGGSPVPHHIRFYYGRVYNTGANFSPTANFSGAGFNVFGDNHEFIHVEVDHNSQNALSTGANNAPYGYYMNKGTGSIIEYGNIHDNGAFSIHGYSSDNTGVTNHTYRYNTIYNNGNGPLHAGSGILLSSGSGNAAYGNIIYSNDVGIRVDYNCTDCRVYNNSVYSNTNYGLEVHNTGTGPLVTNNIFSTNSVNIQNDGGSSPTYTSNLCSTIGAMTNCDVGPEAAVTTFVSPGSNFTLKAGSAAINAGTPLASPYNTDMLAVARPQGSAFDLGALELVSAGSLPGLAVTAPANNSTVTSATLNVTGTTTNSATTVAWVCDRCTPSSGTATGTASWSISGLTLKSGVNVLTITATNANGATANNLTTTYAPTFPGNARVAAYGFEEASGDALDLSGAGRTGTLFNGAVRTDSSGGRFGKGMQLNAVSGQYVRIDDANSLDFTQSFTLSLWVKPAGVMTDYQALIEKGSSGGSQPSYRLYASVAAECGAGGVAGFVAVNGVNQSLACNSSPLSTNAWTHLALTYDNATAQLSLYKNGNSTPIATMTVSGYMEQSTGALYLGASEYGEYFNGVIDEVRLYNYRLPVAGTLNTTPNVACQNASEDVSAPSIISNMNCPLVPLPPPITFKVGAATNLKIGSGSQMRVGTVPQ